MGRIILNAEGAKTLAMVERAKTSHSECIPTAPCAALSPPLDPSVAADYRQLFKALADDTWIQMVQLLASQPEPLCVCHIESAFCLTQSGISYHLKVLRDAGLVRTYRRGTWIYYELDAGRLGAIERFAASKATGG